MPTETTMITTTISEVTTTETAVTSVSEETVTEITEEKTPEEIADEVVSSVVSEFGSEVSSSMAARTEGLVTETSEEATENAVEAVTLPPETAAAEITTGTTAVTEAVSPETEADFLSGQNFYILLLSCLLILFAVMLAVLTVQKKKKNAKNKEKAKAGKTARERDVERIASGRKKSGEKKSKKKSRKKIDISKDVLGTLPYKKVLPDNMWYLGNRLYSKAYTFDDINFNLADEDEQYAYLERYIDFLNTLDNTIDAQICCWNCKLKLDKFREKTLMKTQNDEYFALRYEYNTRVLEENIKRVRTQFRSICALR